MFPVFFYEISLDRLPITFVSLRDLSPAVSQLVIFFLVTVQLTKGLFIETPCRIANINLALEILNSTKQVVARNFNQLAPWSLLQSPSAHISAVAPQLFSPAATRTTFFNGPVVKVVNSYSKISSFSTSSSFSGSY